MTNAESFRVHARNLVELLSGPSPDGNAFTLAEIIIAARALAGAAKSRLDEQTGARIAAAIRTFEAPAPRPAA